MSKETGIYTIPVFDYVTGRFNPAEHELFINLKKTDIPFSGAGQYLRIEAADALSLMLNDFKKENPKIKIILISTTRNFNLQKKIWDEKWSGKRKTTGTTDIRKIKDPAERARLILRYSSMPGTSRHHWGTDFDINSLNNDYYSKGEGKIIFDWLRANAHIYGFYQPYNEGRDKGYMEEKWHWSYVPLSRQILKDWNEVYRADSSRFCKEGIFSGSAEAGNLAPEYVNSINPDCK